MTSCFVYKDMGLTFHGSINTQLVYRFELAQLVARRITKPQRNFLGSNLTGCSFFIQIIFTVFFCFFFFVFFGGGSDFSFSSCLFVYFLLLFLIFLSLKHV